MHVQGNPPNTWVVWQEAECVITPDGGAGRLQPDNGDIGVGQGSQYVKASAQPTSSTVELTGSDPRSPAADVVGAP